MGLNIKNEKTHKLAQSLAKETGETMTEAVTVAISERLNRLRAKNKRARMLQNILAISERFAKNMKGEPIDHDAFLYDENGLPK